MVDLLLKAGADPNLKGMTFGSLLNREIVMGNIKMVELLLSYGADPLITNRTGVDAYHLALERHQHDIANLILNFPYEELKEPDHS
jgi:ankyrin repeat protein